MINILQTEWLKIKSYRAFWWIMGITALSYPGINYIFYSLYKNVLRNENGLGEMAKLIGNPFSFPEVWHTVAYFSSWFIFIPAVVAIMFITNEYSFRTHRQNVIDGWSRNEFLVSKLLDIVIISLVITVLYFIVSLIMGFANSADGSGNIFRLFYYTGLFALQTFAQLSVAFFVGFLVKKAFIALGVFLFYYIILEPILVNVAKVKANDIGRFLPLEISDRLIPVPAFLGKIDRKAYDASLQAIGPHIFYTVIITALIWLFCFRIINRRDL